MKSSYKSDRTLKFIFLTPALTVIFLVLIVPLIYCIRNSLFSLNISKIYEGQHFVGLDNYKAALSDPYFLKAIGISLIITVFAVSIELFLGFFTALFLNKPLENKSPAVKKLFRTLVILPVVLPPVVVGLMWRFMFQYTGIINYLITVLGFRPIDWTTQTTGVISVIIAIVWQNIPFSFLLFLAGLQAIPSDIIDATMVDGVSGLRRIRSIYIPMLTPIIFIALTIRTMDVIRLFDEVFIMTGGGPGRSTETISLFIYKNSFSFFDIGYGSALSVLLFIALMIITVFYLRLIFKKEENGI